jgi:hypothetical protein
MADHPSDATVGRAPELEVVARLDDRPGNPALTRMAGSLSACTLSPTASLRRTTWSR